MNDLIDKSFFQELSERNPKDVCRGALCGYDKKEERYRLSVWGDEYEIYPNMLKINCMSNNNQNVYDYLCLYYSLPSYIKGN